MSTFTYQLRLHDSSGGIPTIKFATAEGCPIPDTYLRGRPVYFGDVELAFCDSYFLAADYADTDEPLNDQELSDLTDQEADFLVTENLEKFGYWED